MPEAAVSPRLRVVANGLSFPRWDCINALQRKMAKAAPVRGLLVPSHVPSHTQTAAKVRGFSPIASGFTAETDWLLEEAGFEPSVPGYGELGRIWARAIARSPGWLIWPLLLGERFPHTGARKPAPRTSSRRRARSLRRIGLVDQNSRPSGFPDQVGNFPDRQSKFPSRDQPATAIVARFWARGRGNHSLGCATPTVIVSQRVWIAIGID